MTEAALDLHCSVGSQVRSVWPTELCQLEMKMSGSQSWRPLGWYMMMSADGSRVQNLESITRLDEYHEHILSEMAVVDLRLGAAK